MGADDVLGARASAAHVDEEAVIVTAADVTDPQGRQGRSTMPDAHELVAVVHHDAESAETTCPEYGVGAVGETPREALKLLRETLEEELGLPRGSVRLRVVDGQQHPDIPRTRVDFASLGKRSSYSMAEVSRLLRQLGVDEHAFRRALKKVRASKS